jgi:hypothetical protein
VPRQKAQPGDRSPVSEEETRVSEIVTLWRRPAAASGALPSTGLTERDVMCAASGIGVLGEGWAVDRHEDYDRAISLVIAGIDAPDSAPSFALHADRGLIQAGLVAADRYRLIGRYERVDDALAAIALVLRDRPLAA